MGAGGVSPAASISTNQLQAFMREPGPQLKYEEAKIEMVLADYSKRLGRTLLFDPATPSPPKGITLKCSEGQLTNEEWFQAVEAVLAMNGVGLVRQGEKFLKIVPITAARKEGMGIRNIDEGNKLKESDELVSQMIQLKNIEAAEAQKMLEALDFKHTYGKIHQFERSNCILYTDTAANINRVMEILKYVDQPIEARETPSVIQIKHAKASLIKQKLEEIIAESQKDQATNPRLKDRGSPGVVTAPTTPTTPTILSPPGVIRAPRAIITPDTAAPKDSALAQILDEAERGIIRGKVKIVADDRTNILIIITRPENMPFFDKIVKVLDVPTEPDIMVKIFRLEFADSEQVATMLNTLIGAQQQNKDTGKPGVTGKVEAEPGKENRGTALEEFARQQREALTRVAEGEGVKSKVGELSAQNIKILSDKRINSLIIMASRLDMATIEEIVKEMDMAVSQVLIEVMILDVSLNDTIQTGVDWIQRSLVAYNRNGDGTRKAVAGFAGGGGGGTMSVDSLNNLSKQFSPGGGLTYYLTAYGLNVDAVAKMVATDSRSRILSSPIILTTDNKKAQLDIVKDQYFYKGQNLVNSYNAAGGISSTPLANVDTKSVGLKLTVTPHINKNKNVQMEIAQEISDANATQPVPGGGANGATANWPVMATKKFEATVSVRSGMTIVLGGLSDNTKSLSKTKIPILGDIPILGLLFGSSDVKKARSEILVFLTPYVMDSAEEIEADAKRRQLAVGDGEDGKWTRGWSDSKLSQPTKAEMKEAEDQRRINEKKARIIPIKSRAETTTKGKRNESASAAAVTSRVIAPAVTNRPATAETSTSGRRNGATTPPAAVIPAVATNKPPIILDPELEKFIKRNDKMYDRNLRKIDEEIQKEMTQTETEKKP